jgi:hypothetical protein
MRQARGIVTTLGLAAVLAAGAGAQIYPATPDWVSSDLRYSTGAALVDLDRDGWLDLVVANGNDIREEPLAVYYNRGDGTFPASPDWESSDDAYNGHLAVADVNGDGFDDVAVARLLESSSGSDAARLYLNQAGTLSSLPDWRSDEQARAFGVAFGDVDLDGRPDLAVATGWPYSPSRLYPDYVYVNAGGALPATASWQSLDSSGDMGVLWADADGDGWLDLVATGRGSPTRVYRNTAGTLAPTPIWTSADNPGQYAIMIAEGDVDGDARRDLLVTDNTQLSGGSGKFRLYTGLSGGYYTGLPVWDYDEGYGSAVALADLDGDGALDLATGAWWDHTRLFLNTGSGLPSLPDWSSGGTSVVEKIVFGDVDRAGETDAVEIFRPRRHALPRVRSERLFHLRSRPVERLRAVVLDGELLPASRYTFDRETGRLTVHRAPRHALEVRYVESDSPDMAVTNWDSTLGNWLYYHRGR